MINPLIIALDLFEKSLVEFCNSHTVDPEKAETRGLVLVQGQDRDILRRELKKLSEFEKGHNGAINKPLS